MLQLSALFPSDLSIDDIMVEGSNAIIKMVSTKSECTCPNCKQTSSRIHSQYQRIIKDLPIINKKVIIYFQTRKFFCDNLSCNTRIFTERFKILINPYAKKTDRLSKHLEFLGFVVNAEVGSILSKQILADVSPDSILRFVKQTELTISTDYQYVGIDDWAIRKGHKYCTLICDLVTKRPIDVLSDRSAQRGQVPVCIYFGNFAGSGELRDGGVLKDLQNGKMYMNNFQYFSNLEKKRDSKGMGDEYEGSLVLQNMDVTLVSHDNKKTPVRFLADNVKITGKNGMLNPLFCMTSLSIGDLENVLIDNRRITGVLKFTDEQKEKIEREFSPYALLISGGHLANTINKQFNNEEIIYIDDKMKYSNFNINYINRINSCMSQHTNVFFWKDISLEYQKEYRIVILNRKNDKPFIYNIGDITQFTKLTTAEELLNNKYEAIINYE